MINCTFENGNKASLRHVVVDVLVIKENNILLVKRVNKLLEGGKWGIVGGFVERDENLKEAVSREIFEETGYTVTDITLLTIRDNPDRPNENRQNISFVFFCTAVEKTGEKDNESSEIKWFNLEEVPNDEELAFDHAQNIKLYLDYKKKDLRLPIIL